MKSWQKIINILFAFPATVYSAPNFIILKDDLSRRNGTDRITFASQEISGFFLSAHSNKKVDTFYLKQGNRTIFFTSLVEFGGPYLKTTENAGLIEITNVFKYEKQKFKLITSYSTSSKTYFSDDPFSSESAAEDPFGSSCTTLNSPPQKEILKWSDAVSKYSTEETVKRSISSECKNILGKDYDRMEKQIVSACSPNKNDLISCLDQQFSTRTWGSIYKATLAGNIFDSNFKISCSTSSKPIPLASFDSSSKNISIYQVTPSSNNRNYKEEFFHEMLHSAGIKSDEKVSEITKQCISLKKSYAKNADHMMATSSLSLNQVVADKKEGVEVSVPNQVQEIQPTAVAKAISVTSKSMEVGSSTDNAAQFNDIASASKATFKSFEPTMAAAYNSAVGTAFAKETVGNDSGTTSAMNFAIANSKSTSSGATGSRSPASQSASSANTYEVPTLPDSATGSQTGDLGNGLKVKAQAVKVGANREVAGNSGSGAEESGSVGGSVGAGSSGGRSLASIPRTDRPDLQRNVPKLQEEDNFLKTVTQGKYDQVKAELLKPQNLKLLEEKRIQYRSGATTIGSTQPVLILNDLGSKFSIRRVIVE